MRREPFPFEAVRVLVVVCVLSGTAARSAKAIESRNADDPRRHLVGASVGVGVFGTDAIGESGLAGFDGVLNVSYSYALIRYLEIGAEVGFLRVANEDAPWGSDDYFSAVLPSFDLRLHTGEASRSTLDAGLALRAGPAFLSGGISGYPGEPARIRNTFTGHGYGLGAGLDLRYWFSSRVAGQVSANFVFGRGHDSFDPSWSDVFSERILFIGVHSFLGVVVGL